MSSITSAPGTNLVSFLKSISFDLKRRKLEYLIIGCFNKDITPIGMIEVKGRSNFVGFNLDELLDQAKMIRSFGVCLLHNHPTVVHNHANLEPSKEDLASLKTFIEKLKEFDLNYLGDWIASNSHIVEILNIYNNSKKLQLENPNLFSDIDITTSLQPSLLDVIKEITKNELTHRSWFRFSTEYIGQSKFVFNVIRIKYYGYKDADYFLRVDVTNSDKNEGTGILTVEEALKAYDTLNEIYEITSKLVTKPKEYTEITVSFSESINVGVYGDMNNWDAFITINLIQTFMKINDFKKFELFVQQGIEKIEQLIYEDNIIAIPS
jgi:hypothetical protein